MSQGCFRPKPLLNIGATDKKMKDFGPAMKFEKNEEKVVEVADCEDLMPPAEIVQELLTFNHMNDSLSECCVPLMSFEESSIAEVRG